MGNCAKATMAGVLLLALAAGAGAQTVIVNGQTVQVATIQQDGKLYVEAVPLAEALGATAAYDSLNRKLIIVMPVAGGAMGTDQMAGEWAVMGLPYTINGDDPLNFTLKSAEFAVTRLNVGDESVVPQGKGKLLVLHMTVQNPQPRERRLYWADLDLTAVDALNVNREWSQELGIESTREAVDVDLKPAQKIDLYTAIVVPAEGPVPKLIVKSGEGGVLRYDLRGKVAPLAAPFADPQDESGVTARERVVAQDGVYYPMGLFDVKYSGVAEPAPAAYDEPEQGMAYLAFALTLRNGSADEERLYADPFRAAVHTLDGRKVEWDYELVGASDLESVDADLEPGEELEVMVVFEVPADTPLGSFEFREGEHGRTYIFDLAGYGVAAAPSAASQSGGGGLEDLLEDVLGGIF